jgi:hypothetical protein
MEWTNTKPTGPGWYWHRAFTAINGVKSVLVKFGLIYFVAGIIGWSPIPPCAEGAWNYIHYSQTVSLNAHTAKNIFIFDLPNNIYPLSIGEVAPYVMLRHPFGNASKNFGTSFIPHYWNVLDLPVIPALLESWLRWESHAGEIPPSPDNGKRPSVILESIEEMCAAPWNPRRRFYEKSTMPNQVRQQIGGFGIIRTLDKFVSGSPQIIGENHESNGCASEYEGKDRKSNRSSRNKPIIFSFLFFCFFIAISFYLQWCGWGYLYRDRTVLGATVISGGVLFGLGGLGWFIFG